MGVLELVVDGSTLVLELGKLLGRDFSSLDKGVLADGPVRLTVLDGGEEALVSYQVKQVVSADKVRKLMEALI